jgi:hypothetical protein
MTPITAAQALRLRLVLRLLLAAREVPSAN